MDDWLGNRDQASRRVVLAIETARKLPHRYSLSFVLALSAFVYLCRREPEPVRRVAAEAIDLSREQGIAQWLAWANVFHGWAVAARGNVAGGLEQANDGFDSWCSLGGLYAQPNHLTILADIHRMAGAQDTGLRCLDKADGIVRDRGFGQWVSELYRMRGVLLTDQSRFGEAELQLREAIDIARDQDARTLELRAATSLARLWSNCSRRGGARDLLAPIYDWFTEGFDTADLKDAKALLDELR